MSFPTDLKGRTAKREELVRVAEERARLYEHRLNRSMVCSGASGYVVHERCVGGPERCICECHDPKSVERHEADA